MGRRASALPYNPDNIFVSIYLTKNANVCALRDIYKYIDSSSILTAPN